MKELEIKSESIGPCQLRVTVEVPEERVQQTMRQIAKKISRDLRFPGFRKGRIPYEFIVQRYGQDLLRQDAAEEMADQVYREMLEKQDIPFFAPGTLESVEYDPLRYVFVVPLPPIVDLGDYRSIRVRPPKVKVGRKEVKEVIKAIRDAHAMLEPVEDRGVQKGDVVSFSVTGVTDDGELWLKDDEVSGVVVDPKDEYPVPGFHKNLIGMRVGEERTFTIRTDEVDEAESLEIEFVVNLTAIYRRILPRIDDDLARTVGQYENLQELKDDIKNRLEEQKRKQARQEYLDEVIERLMEGARVEYPPEMLEERLDNMIEDFGQIVEEKSGLDLDEYLRLTGETEDDLREQLRLQAEEALRATLVISEVARREHLYLTDDDMKIVEDQLASLDLDPDEWEDGQDELANDVFVAKIMDRLEAIARGEAPPLEED